MSWSSGKDSAHALAQVLRGGDVEIVGLVTTVTATYDRVAMHAVRRSLLERQAAALGLPLHVVELPTPCTNEEYEARFGTALARAVADGITHVVFGDLFLEDVRAYRERQLATHGLTPVFPLWQRDTRELAREMVASGLRARLTCVDPKVLDRRFAGRLFDDALLAELPASVDPCGERGEFHTFVTHSPAFSEPIEVAVGDVVERDGFVFADCV
ncbi:MAG TPA: hypothetical protein VL326_06145 [Kofleriaceae bacterium]|nr:hypothetical protein [Kofleriaceae bacterium]